MSTTTHDLDLTAGDIATRTDTNDRSRATDHDGNGAVVAVRGLTKQFGERTVLDQIDLDVQPGEFVALLGRSGTGKSTLLRILGDLDEATDGDVHVTGSSAVVFQDARLLPWATVAENVVLGLSGREAKHRASEILAEVGLDGHEDAWPATLSGGEAQRAALARALVREPDLLLLDEPFGALDALTRISMHRLLRRLCEKHHPAVVLVTHDVDEAILLSERIVVLDGGHIVHDTRVDLAGARRRESDGFIQLRHVLLDALGVTDDDH